MLNRVLHVLFLASLPIFAAGRSQSTSCNIGVRLISPVNAAFPAQPSSKGAPTAVGVQMTDVGTSVSTNSSLILIHRQLPSHWGDSSPVVISMNPAAPGAPSVTTIVAPTKLARHSATLFLAYN